MMGFDKILRDCICDSDEAGGYIYAKYSKYNLYMNLYGYDDGDKYSDLVDDIVKYIHPNSITYEEHIEFSISHIFAKVENPITIVGVHILSNIPDELDVLLASRNLELPIRIDKPCKFSLNIQISFKAGRTMPIYTHVNVDTDRKIVTISADSVKELRSYTGAGMMECKRALEGASGDWEEAIDILRNRPAIVPLK